MSLAMHHVVLPPAFVVASILEDVFAFAVFHVSLLLADVLASAYVLLMHVYSLLNFLLLHQLPTPAKLSLSHRMVHHVGICQLPELPRMPRGLQIPRFVELHRAQSHGGAEQ